MSGFGSSSNWCQFHKPFLRGRIVSESLDRFYELLKTFFRSKTVQLSVSVTLKIIKIDPRSPQLYPYQQTAVNVLYFSFIHPKTMQVPPAFVNLAKTRGTGAPGSVPARTMIVFSIGKVNLFGS